MKIILLLLSGVLIFISCIDSPVSYKESNYIFKLPQKEIYIKTSKRFGAKFVVFFAQDSLSLEKSKDSIEFKTGEESIFIIIDTINMYLETHHPLALKSIGNDNYELRNETIPPPIIQMGSDKFNIKLIPDTIIRLLFKNDEVIYPYTSIHIYTRTYCVTINQQEVKKGNIDGR